MAVDIRGSQLTPFYITSWASAKRRSIGSLIQGMDELVRPIHPSIWWAGIALRRNMCIFWNVNILRDFLGACTLLVVAPWLVEVFAIGLHHLKENWICMNENAVFFRYLYSFWVKFSVKCQKVCLKTQFFMLLQRYVNAIIFSRHFALGRGCPQCTGR